MIVTYIIIITIYITRISGRYAPFILAPAGGSGVGRRPTPVMPVTERRPCVHASCGGPLAHHCGPSAQSHQHLKFGSPCHIRGGLFFEFFRSDVCSLRFEVKPTSSLHIHWTLLTNFHFLHHPQFLHRLKTIAKYRNVHAHSGLKFLFVLACYLHEHHPKFCEDPTSFIMK